MKNKNMEDRSLSKIADVDKKILSELDDKSLLEFCKTNKYGYKLCNDELFWKIRFFQKFGRMDKNPDRSWKDFYLKIVYYLDKYKNINTALENISIKGMKNIDLIKVLLVRGADVNRGLVGAAIGGHKNLVDYFVSRGANDFINAYIGAKMAKQEELLDYFREKD